MGIFWEIRKIMHQILPYKYRSLPFLIFVTVIFTSVISLICKIVLSSNGYEANMSFHKGRQKSDLPQLFELVKNEPVIYKKYIYKFLIALLILSRVSVVLALFSGEGF